jgi:hypothetical protein
MKKYIYESTPNSQIYENRSFLFCVLENNCFEYKKFTKSVSHLILCLRVFVFKNWPSRRRLIYESGKYLLIVMLLSAFGLVSCTSDLDKMPTNGVTNSEQYLTVAGYKQVLATLLSYPAYNNFLRYYWEMQEYPTDEALGTWDDDGNTQEYHKLD